MGFDSGLEMVFPDGVTFFNQDISVGFRVKLLDSIRPGSDRAVSHFHKMFAWIHKHYERKFQIIPLSIGNCGNVTEYFLFSLDETNKS